MTWQSETTPVGLLAAETRDAPSGQRPMRQSIERAVLTYLGETVQCLIIAVKTR